MDSIFSGVCYSVIDAVYGLWLSRSQYLYHPRQSSVDHEYVTLVCSDNVHIWHIDSIGASVLKSPDPASPFIANQMVTSESAQVGILPCAGVDLKFLLFCLINDPGNIASDFPASFAPDPKQNSLNILRAVSLICLALVQCSLTELSGGLGS